MEIIILSLLIVLIIISALILKSKNNVESLDENRELQKNIIQKEEKIKSLEEDVKIAEARLLSFDEIKAEKIQLDERLKIAEQEKSSLKSEVVKLKFNEENRNETQRKGIESINTIQQNLQSEIARVNDERVREEKENIEKMKKIWNEHEKDVQSYIQLICNNHVIFCITHSIVNY